MKDPIIRFIYDPSLQFSGNPGLNSENEIDNLNFAAVNLFKENLSPGSQYYRISKQSRAELETFLNRGKSGGKPDRTIGIQLFEFLPWPMSNN
ncbi:MAG: hypothetical protein WC836_15785 [Desulfobacula sp.]|jgi:hypothetical protein